MEKKVRGWRGAVKEVRGEGARGKEEKEGREDSGWIEVGRVKKSNINMFDGKN